ncbi:MAG: hypothetical protein A2283_10610 [Lentisphaerae bacterium RIFOXYA12_FULL_48_11]|nr:MAG: hypothetical protein A2283_10610 [Lentisphaerae bacterium RIFOXYA12_FULL_48_11]
MKQKFLLAATLIILATPVISLGGFISLEVNTSSYFSKGHATVTAHVTNKGNEQAQNLQMEAFLGTNVFFSDIKELVETNGTHIFTINIDPLPDTPGIFNIGIKLHYEDSNGYPSTAITSAPLITGETNKINPVSASLTSPDIIEKGRMLLSLSANTSNAIETSIRLISPDELSASLPPTNIILQPYITNIVPIEIANVSALTGSCYPIVVIADCLKDGFHYSSVTHGRISINSATIPLLQNYRPFWIVLACIMAITSICIQLWHKSITQQPELKPRNEHIFDSICVVIVATVLAGFILYHIPLKYVFMNTTITGGDTTAHNYLASHLKDQLFHHGRIVSWANGWWCGFPMFQYYFPLPYIVIALLSTIIPFNIAFKIISIIGIVALPICAYLSGRLLRFPPPTPILLATASMPLLFTNAHTMWGVNIYSTFAGMISNSISFPIMLIFIASSWRDSNDGKFRIRTVVLLVLLLASHFFTSVIGILCVAILPFLKPKAGFWQAILVISREALLAFILMAWWLIPLVLKKEYSLEFGTNWNIQLLSTVPTGLLLPVCILAAIALIEGITRRVYTILVFGWMFACSILLFHFGYDHIAQVFVNVRLWPFIFFSILALCATGTGAILAGFRYKGLAVTSFLLFILLFGMTETNNIRSWTRWNYEGAEAKPRWPVLRKLIEPLKGTTGRLANDLHEHNNSFGSSRIFESIPHLIGKPILEGGLVNSAIGSMFSYYIQGETSKNCAGFPNLVSPASFNFERATKHLHLFNVKHFIAKWSETKKALSQSAEWRFISEAQGWQLYELITNTGSYIYTPKYYPTGVIMTSKDSDNWKKAGMEWLYSFRLIEQPFILFKTIEQTNDFKGIVISEESYLKYCRDSRSGIRELPYTPIPLTRNISITDETVSDNRIKFRTNGIGLPHIVKISYFPNWKVKGAKSIHMVTPCFMLVYPDSEEVDIYYGYTLADKAGMEISIFGIIALIVLHLNRRKSQDPQDRSNASQTT